MANGLDCHDDDPVYIGNNGLHQEIRMLRTTIGDRLDKSDERITKLEKLLLDRETGSQATNLQDSLNARMLEALELNTKAIDEANKFRRADELEKQEKAEELARWQQFCKYYERAQQGDGIMRPANRPQHGPPRNNA